VVYGSQELSCSYEPDERDPDFFEIEDRSQTSLDDEEPSELDDQDRYCDGCGRTYTAPRWYPDTPPTEELAECLGLDVTDVAACRPVAAALQHAGAVTVSEQPHATLIEVSPNAERRGRGPDRWSVERCTQCGGDMSTPHACVEALQANHAPVLDRRHLPVLLETQRCASCI
jgi:hypothetical protein